MGMITDDEDKNDYEHFCIPVVIIFVIIILW